MSKHYDCTNYSLTKLLTVLALLSLTLAAGIASADDLQTQKIGKVLAQIQAPRYDIFNLQVAEKYLQARFVTVNWPRTNAPDDAIREGAFPADVDQIAKKIFSSVFGPYDVVHLVYCADPNDTDAMMDSYRRTICFNADYLASIEARSDKEKIFKFIIAHELSHY